MDFEWNEFKRHENIRKHGIDFEDVKAAFSEPMIVGIDDRKNYGEDRWIGIGIINGIVIVVVFTEPRDESIRIISARKATKYENKIYYQKIGH